MKKTVGIFMAVVFCSTLLGTVNLYAEESSDAVGTDLKDELTADKQAVVEQKDTMKANAQAAHAEEKNLRAQIKEAKLAGDKEKVKELRAQLKAVHQENVQKMKEDKKSVQVAKKEVRKDKKQLHQERKAVRTERRGQKQRE